MLSGIERQAMRASTRKDSSQETWLTGALEYSTRVRNLSSEPSSTEAGVTLGQPFTSLSPGFSFRE